MRRSLKWSVDSLSSLLLPKQQVAYVPTAARAATSALTTFRSHPCVFFDKDGPRSKRRKLAPLSISPLLLDYTTTRCVALRCDSAAIFWFEIADHRSSHTLLESVPRSAFPLHVSRIAQSWISRKGNAASSLATDRRYEDLCGERGETALLKM